MNRLLALLAIGHLAFAIAAPAAFVPPPNNSAGLVIVDATGSIITGYALTNNPVWASFGTSGGWVSLTNSETIYGEKLFDVRPSFVIPPLAVGYAASTNELYDSLQSATNALPWWGYFRYGEPGGSVYFLDQLVGNGGGLTNVPASAITGTIPAAQMPAKVTQRRSTFSNLSAASGTAKYIVEGYTTGWATEYQSRMRTHLVGHYVTNAVFFLSAAMPATNQVEVTWFTNGVASSYILTIAPGATSVSNLVDSVIVPAHGAWSVRVKPTNANAVALYGSLTWEEVETP